MINTNKTKMSRWKYAAILFIFIAGLLIHTYSSAQSILKSSTHGLDFPAEVKMLLESVENYTLPDGSFRTKLTDLEDWAAKNPDAKFYIEKIDYGKIDKGLSPPNNIIASDQEAIEQYKKEYKKAEGFVSFGAVANKPGADYDYEYAYIIRGITDHKVERSIYPDSDYINRIDLPYYWGGPEAMNAYLAKKIKYPAIAVARKVEGTVFISFVVNADGYVTNPYVSKGIGSGCDEEALAAVAGFPKWRPGMQHGTFIDLCVTVPVTFKL